MTIILKGVDEILDEWLGLTGRIEYGTRSNVPKYESKKAAIDLSRNGGPLANEDGTISTASEMVRKAMKCLSANLGQLRQSGMGQPANSNWKWEKSYHLASHNESAEKQLEKYVAFFLDDRWVNQVPVCNGLGQGANACRIDLAFRAQEKEYELIELKFGLEEANPGSDHPLYAAMEILRYGLLYLLFRRESLLTNKHHLLQAENIRLVVLAPVAWYRFNTRAESTEAFKFDWLEKSITDGLQAYLNDEPIDLLTMGFRFEALSDAFVTAYRPLTEAISDFRANNLEPRSATFP